MHQYVLDFRTKLTQACQLAQDNLKSSQTSMKDRYDNYTTERTFKQGNKVRAGVTGRPLQARYFGPYVVEKTH